MRGKFILKGKKGDLFGFTLSDFWAYLSFVFVILLFYAFFKIQAINVKENKILGADDEINADLILINYLRTYIEDNNKANMADLIVRYYLEENKKKRRDLKKLLQEKSKKIFSENYPHLRWRLKITDEIFGAEAIASGQTTTKLTKEKTLIDNIAFICTTIPLPTLREPIKIELDLLNDGLISGYAREEYNRAEHYFKC
jgi:hypothetical protein